VRVIDAPRPSAVSATDLSVQAGSSLSRRGWQAGRCTTTKARKHIGDSRKVEQMNSQGVLVFTLVPVIGVLLTALLALRYTKDPILRTAAKGAPA
jgi:hypothetical protein